MEHIRDISEGKTPQPITLLLVVQPMTDFDNFKSGDNVVRNTSSNNDEFSSCDYTVPVRQPGLGLAEDSRTTDSG